MIRLVLALAAVLLFAEIANSQEAEETRPGGASVAIPVSEVVLQADELAKRLRKIRQDLQPRLEIVEISDAIEERVLDFEAAKEAHVDSLLVRPSLAELEDADREWSRQAALFSKWRHTLTQRVAELESRLEELNKWSERWEASAESEPPREILEMIEQSLSQISEVKQAIAERRSELLPLQNRVTKQQALADEVVDSIEDSREALRGRLFEPDHPPIWRSIDSEEIADGRRLFSLFESRRASLDSWARESAASFFPLLLFFALSFVAARGLKQSVAKRAAESAEATSANQSGPSESDVEDSSLRVLTRPMAIASLLALLSIFWLFPLAPDGVSDVVGLLLLIPVLRLLPLLIRPEFQPILYSVGAFYIVDRMRGLLAGVEPLSRFLFTAECGAAAILCLVLARSFPEHGGDRSEPINDPEGGWVERALKLAFVAFVVAFAANVFGYVSLSILIGDGLLSAMYRGAAVYAGVRVMGVSLDVATRTEWAHRIHFLRARRAVAVEWIRWAIATLATAFWLYWSLEAFGIQDSVVSSLHSALTVPFEVGSVSVSAGNLLAFGLAIISSMVLARIVRFVLMEDVFTRVRTGRGVPYAVSSIVYYLILFAGFLLAVAAAGIDLSKFALLAGAFGVGLGFGLQNVVNNFVSGVILLFERPIQVGDSIDMGDLLGRVRRIGIRSSTVATYDGAEVVVPNADLISQRVVNWTLSDRRRRIDIAIGVQYGSSPDEVMELLVRVASENADVLRQPAPLALFRAHGVNSLEFELRSWVEEFEDWILIETELNRELNRALSEAGIAVAIPQRDLHIRSVDGNKAREIASRNT